jgi:hypothetical protein
LKAYNSISKKALISIFLYDKNGADFLYINNAKNILQAYMAALRGYAFKRVSVYPGETSRQLLD